MQQVNFSNNLQNKYSFKQKRQDEKERSRREDILLSSLATSLICYADNKLATNVPNSFTKSMLRKMKEIIKKISPSDLKKFEEDFDKSFKNLKLQDCGVSVFKCNDLLKDIDRIKEHLKKRNILESSIEFYSQVVSEYMKNNNSCYTLFGKTIYTSKDTRLSLFHEMGHAYNHNKTVFAKFLQKYRYLHMKIPIPISIAAILLPDFARYRTKQNNDINSKESAFDKLVKCEHCFIKASPLIVFASFLPMIVEEGLASLQGQKFAKKVLNKDMLKKVKRTNLLGFYSYLFLGTFVASILWASLKIKNIIQDKLLNKT